MAKRRFSHPILGAVGPIALVVLMLSAVAAFAIAVGHGSGPAGLSVTNVESGGTSTAVARFQQAINVLPIPVTRKPAAPVHRQHRAAPVHHPASVQTAPSIVVRASTGRVPAPVVHHAHHVTRPPSKPASKGGGSPSSNSAPPPAGPGGAGGSGAPPSSPPKGGGSGSGGGGPGGGGP